MLEVFSFLQAWRKVGPGARVYAIEYKERRFFLSATSIRRFRGDMIAASRSSFSPIVRRKSRRLGPGQHVTIGAVGCGGYALLSRLRIRAREMTTICASIR